jgi:hypothetical protein
MNFFETLRAPRKAPARSDTSEQPQAVSPTIYFPIGESFGIGFVPTQSRYCVVA